MPRPLRILHLLLIAALTACGPQDRGTTQGFNPRYRVLTADLLAQEPDSTLESAVLEHVGWSIGGDYDREHEIVTALSRGFQAIYSTWWLEAEVNNGGFNQYFFNSSGRFAQEALAGFELLGATDHANLVRQAITIHNTRKTVLDAARRKGSAEAFSETYDEDPFAPLDATFFGLQTDLAALRVRYIRAHLGEFAHP